jgi:hypothetical protein
MISFCYESNCLPSRYNGNASVRCLGNDSSIPLSGISSQYIYSACVFASGRVSTVVLSVVTGFSVTSHEC